MRPRKGNRAASRRLAAATLALALIPLAAPGSAWGHAALTKASPAPGAVVQRPPRQIRLEFSEAVEASVSEIHVSGPGGTPVSVSGPVALGATTLAAPISATHLDRGTYTVDWRVVSADDGHSTGGTFRFGIGAAPQGEVASVSNPGSSRLELVARVVFIVGLIALLGAVGAELGGFGRSPRANLGQAFAGWIVALIGLALLAEAQRRTADSSIGSYFDTPAGHDLIWREAGLLAAGVGLPLAWRRPRQRRAAFVAMGLGALVAVVAHVSAGHAETGSWPTALTVTAQALHFTAVCVWFGGLSALLLGLRGADANERRTAVRRFGAVAGIAFAVVVATGGVRAIDELSSPGQLTSTGYGRAILAKIAIAGLIGLVALRSRRASREAVLEVDPLRRRSRAELSLAAVAVVLAAVLGSTAPPVPAAAPLSRGLSATASAPGGSIEARLTTAAARPGPNRFTVGLSGDDSGSARSVSLRFRSLDDPRASSSALRLRPAADGTWTGSGRHLPFDGRWAVVAVVGLDGGGTRMVPMRIDVPGPKYFVSVQHIPGQNAKYTMQVGSVGELRVVPAPGRHGPNRIYVTAYTPFGGVSHVASMVVAVGASGGGGRCGPRPPADPGQVRRPGGSGRRHPDRRRHGPHPRRHAPSGRVQGLGAGLTE